MLLAALIACQPEVGALRVPVDARDVVVEPLVNPGTEGLAASGPAVVYAEGDVWSWVDPRDEQVVTSVRYGTDGLVLGAGEAGGDRFVLTDAGVYVLRGDSAVRVGAEALAERDLGTLCGDGRQLWLTPASDGGGAVVWRGDVLAGVSVGDHAASGPVACGGRVDGEEATWVADGPDIHAVVVEEGRFSLERTDALPGEITALAADGLGLPWAVAGERLYRLRDGRWWQLRLGARVHAVFGGSRSAGVWVRTGEGPRFVPSTDDPRAIAPAQLATEPPHGRWVTDDLGRLLVRDASGALSRVSDGRPLWVEGLPEGEIVDPVAITLHPTLPGEVASIEARLLETGTDLVVEDGLLWLDPGELPQGRFTLRVVTTYTGGASRRDDVAVVLNGLQDGVTWANDIRPIHEGSCALCHTNAAETILDGPEAWEAQFDTLLDQVRRGAMPLGREDLLPEEIARIEAWAEGGFLR